MKLRRIIFAASLLLALAIPFEAAVERQQNQAKQNQTASQHSRRQRRKVQPAKTRETAAPKVVSAATTTPSGLTYVITQRGTGRQPLTGETVIVNYTGLLGNGMKFDSSLDHGQPLEFPLGVGRVIKGWDEGIAKLHVGEQATFIIPPDLGYGARSRGSVIPPNATLIFIVELVGIKEPQAPN